MSEDHLKNIDELHGAMISNIDDTLKSIHSALIMIAVLVGGCVLAVVFC